MCLRRFKIIGLGLFFCIFTVHADPEKNISTNGWFIGAGWDSDYIRYTTTETTLGEVENDNISPKTSISNVSGYKLTFGKRTYMIDATKMWVRKLGFGVSGWVGQENYKVTSIINHTVDNEAGGGVSNQRENTPFMSQGDALVFGAEAQAYYDFFRFKTGKINHTMGLLMGVGYEFSQFSNVKYTTLSKSENEFVWTTGGYLDSGFVYDVGLHYAFAAANRIELGYRIKNYSKTIQSYPTDKNGWTTKVITYKLGFNALGSLYATYSFTF